MHPVHLGALLLTIRQIADDSKRALVLRDFFVIQGG